MAGERAPELSNLERHLRAYRRAQNRHARRVERYGMSGRRSMLNISDHEDKMLRQAFNSMNKILERISEEDE